LNQDKEHLEARVGALVKEKQDLEKEIYSLQFQLKERGYEPRRERAAKVPAGKVQSAASGLMVD